MTVYSLFEKVFVSTNYFSDGCPNLNTEACLDEQDGRSKGMTTFFRCFFHMFLYAAIKSITTTKPKISMPEMTNNEDQMR